MNMRFITEKIIALLIVALLSMDVARAQTTFTWANSNVTGTPTSPLDWYTGGDNDQGTWTGGDPVGADDTTIQIFENTTTALPNTATPSTQAVNLNNGGNAFQLGTLTLSGRGSSTGSANLTMTLSGDDLNFSASSGTINLNAVNATRTITHNVNHAIQLGTASSSSTLTLDGNGNSAFNFAGAITELSSGSKLVKSGTSGTTISGPVTVSGGLEINGGGLALTHSANAITGGIVLNGGQWNNVKATDINNNPITVNGAFTIFGGTTISSALTLNANLTAQRGTFTFDGPITGSGGLTVNADGSGSSTFNLNSTDNTFTGALVFTTGLRDATVNVRSLGDSTGAGNIRFTVAPSFAHQFNFTGTAPLTLNHRQFEIAAASATRFQIRNQSTQAFTINTDLSVTTTGATGILLGGTGAGLSTFAGNIGNGESTALNVTKIESGTWVFSAANTHTGPTTVSAGTLRLNNQLAVQNSTLIMNGSTAAVAFDAAVAGNAFTFGGLAASSSGTGYNIVLANTSSNPIALTVGGNHASTVYAGVLSGGGSLIKTGAGTLTLSGSNSYTGGTTISGGKLLLNGATALPATGTVAVGAAGHLSLADGTARDSSVSAVTLASGANLSFDWTGDGTGDRLTSAADITPTSGSNIAINLNRSGTPGGSVTLLTGGGSSTLDNSNFYLANATDYTATLSTPTAATLVVDNYASQTALDTIYWQGNKLAGASTAGVDNAWALSDGTTSNWSSTTSAYTATPLTPGATANVIFADGQAGKAQQSTTLGADVTVNSVVIDDTTAVTIAGTDGAALTLMSSLSTPGTVGGTAGSAITVTSTAANPTISSRVVLGSNQTWNVASGKTLTVDGAVSGGSSLTKADEGTVVLNGVNAFSGNLTISGGTLQIGTNNTANGASLNNSVYDNGRYSGNIAIAVGAALDVQTNANQVYSGVISGGGNLLKSYTGKLILSGGNSYTGTTSVDAGVLNIQHATALGTTAAGTTVASGAALEIQGGINVSGAEALTLNGTGISNGGALRNISGTNTYRGPITLIGTTRINSDSGTLTLDVASGNAIAGSNQNLTFGGAGNITVADGIATGSGTLTKDGSGILTLSGANAYTGTASVEAGVLNIRNATALGTTAAGTTVASGAALEIQGGITVGAEALTLNGTGISSGGVLRNISGTNTYGGLVTLGSASRINSDTGTLTLSNTGTITGSGYGLTLGGDGNITINSIIGTDAGTLSKDGSGTVLLTGTNTYTGETNILAGTLQLNGSTHADSTMNVATNGTLTGSGTVNGDTTLTGDGVIGMSDGSIGGTLGVTGGNWNGTGTVAGLVTSGSGTFTIGPGAELTATGGLNVTGGTLAAGNSASTITGSVNYTSSSDSTFQGVIAGADNTLTLNNAAATLTLTGGNSYTGGTTISGGTLQVGNGTGAASLGSGPITNNAALAYNVPGDVEVANSMSGSGSLQHLGTGTLALTGDLDGYTGTYSTSTGTIDMSAASSTTGMTVQVGGDGELSIGSDIAVMNIATLDLDAGAVINWQFINDTDGNYDQIIASNNLVLTGLGARSITINVQGLDGYTVAKGDTFTLFDGNVTGFDASIFDIVGVNQGFWTITQGSLILTSTIPEPSTLLLAGLGLAGLTLRRRRR